MAKIDPIHDEARFFTELIPAEGVDSEVGLNIIRAGRLLSERTGYLRDAGMSEAQFNVLVVLEGLVDGLMQTEVARRMLVSRANISGLVKGMLAKGWIFRHPVPGDRRAARLTVTEAGMAVLEGVMPAHFDHVHRAMACLDEADKRQLIDLLTRLRGHLAAERAASND